MRPLLISHRGDTSSASENTMEAFTSAFAKGAQGIEFDVQLNDQGEIIIVHHYLYDKFSHYPRLEDVLQQFGQKGLLEIELKGLEIELVEKVAALIGKYQPKQYSLTSNILPLLPVVRQYFPKADIGAIIKPYFIEDWIKNTK